MESKEESSKVKKPYWADSQCKGCGKHMGLNAYETCKDCRMKECRSCGKKFQISKTLFSHCSPCKQALRKMSKHLGDS